MDKRNFKSGRNRMIYMKLKIIKCIKIQKGLMICLCLCVFNSVHAMGKNPLKRENKSPRQTVNFNRDWKFILGDMDGGSQKDFNDQNWSGINLPHSFSMSYFLSPDFYVGYGWYRKDFELSSKDLGNQLFLEFEGVFQDAEVFVNGKQVGRHKGGYTGFSFDITNAVNVGKNVIAVRVNNKWDARLAPRAGEHVFSGGIYRDVYLVTTKKMHVTWFGTRVTTPELSEKSGKVNVETEIRNDFTVAKKCRHVTEVIDPSNNKCIAKTSSDVVIEPGTVKIINQTTASIIAPKLWSPEQPILYKTVTKIYDNGVLCDRYETSFGFRWFKWTADKGFFLNGKHFYINGANSHQDHAGWGDAVTNTGFDRDVKLIKEAGFNFIRGSHYPHDPSFSEACDKQGMLLWSENNFWGIGGFKKEGDWNSSAYPTIAEDQPDFDTSVKQSLREMIRIHRNHPSIVTWSMCNEVFFTHPPTLPKVRSLLKELVDLSHELDPARPAAIGGCQRGDMDTIGDIAGYNGDGARLFINPKVANIVSEYGSTISNRPGVYEPGWGELQQEQFSWRSGQVIWCAFDHGSVGGQFGAMGMLDYFRLPKRMWYWYRNQNKNIPSPKWPENGIPYALKLTSDKKTIAATDGTDDVQLIVSVLDKNGVEISNCPNIKLSIEGPGEFPTGNEIVFDPLSDIAIRDGKAAIEFRSYQVGKTVIRAESPGLETAFITIESKGNSSSFESVRKQVVGLRPYKKYVKQEMVQDSIPINLAALRPSKSSGDTAEYGAKNANDSDNLSYWNPINGLTTTWWQVDLENIYQVSKIKLDFLSALNIQYQVVVSVDGVNWEEIIVHHLGVKPEKEFVDRINSKKQGRFLKIIFANETVNRDMKLANVEVFGTSASK